MRLTYVGDQPRDVCPSGAREFHVEPGETFEVDNATGKSLLEQPRLFVAAKKEK